MAGLGLRSLKGLVTLITGGASGLGRATADRFLQQGANVVICDLKTSKGQEVAAEFGANCIFVPTDVSLEQDVKNALEETTKKFQRLDVAVNCAGVAVAFKLYNFIHDKPHKIEDLTKLYETNVIGSFNILRLASGVMVKNEPDPLGQRGVVINTSSNAAYEGLLGQTAYAASSHSLVSMTLTAARDLESQGIRCCTIAPGFMDTELLGTLPVSVTDFIAATTPFPKRLGKPQEFAHMVQCVVENTMLNGEVIRLDGGCRMTI